ncbi:MAG: HD superfamily phosphohydrolase [Mariniblastus sp.]|jgi:HD superfamily phosphohydrolase
MEDASMDSILEIPEVRALDGPARLIRIPSQIDVPVTDRLLKLIDTPEFQRLTKISQLGMVSFVYPAAHHNRFEHSLGVYRNSLLFLKQFANQSRFTDLIDASDAVVLMLAALLHDIGHWPYCHPIEDIRISDLPTHENFSTDYILRPSIANCIKNDFGVSPQRVIDVIHRRKRTPTEAILSSILSGPIDIDKMDYLYRDSLHAGVPYGQNFDSLRLMRSLCLNESGDRLAITSKGRTAAELMVFARYVMFSEVYWHHTVRSATAMFQRAFYLWHQSRSAQVGFEKRVKLMFESSESEMVAELRKECDGTPAGDLLMRLFGAQRRLFKCVADFSFNENADVFQRVAHQPYGSLLQISNRLADLMSEKFGQPILSDAVLVDAPPVGLEVQFDVDVFDKKKDRYRKLGDVSPVVKTLATKQFDDFVKQVRVFVAPEWSVLISDCDFAALLIEASEAD